MESFIHADIFFVVTTVSVFFVAVALIVALVYMVRILRNTEHLVGRARKEGDEIMDDVHALHRGMEKVARRRRLGRFFFTARKRKKRS